MATAAEVQSMLDLLGPAWRLFYAPDEGEPLELGVVPRVEIEGEPSEHEGEQTFLYRFVPAGEFSYRFVEGTAPEVLQSGEDGHLLVCRRPDFDGGWAYDAFQLSTVTLTPAHLAFLASRRVVDTRL